MPVTKSKADAAVLENYRIALENSTTNTDIATVMAELGYDEALIAEGKTLLETARVAYEGNKTEDDETNIAYQTFTSQKEALESIYSLHRKKAKVIFRNDPVTAASLAITGAAPRNYINILEAMKKFYSTASLSEDIKTKLARLKVTEEEITKALADITALETARANYLRERGESQEATQTKDHALSELSTWMSEFYAVARIALEDQPQLLEVLGKTVKS